KTTFLKALLGMISPESGHVRIFDCSCEKLRCEHRARIGYLPQKEFIDPDFPLTVFEAVMMGRFSSLGLFRRPGRLDETIVREALEAVGLSDSEKRPFGHLSGGQQQRVLIARALAQKPKVLLLDEPTTGIDIPTQRTILDLIAKLHNTLGLTILLVTHDIKMILPYVDRLALFKTRLFAAGPPKDVLREEVLESVYGREGLVSGKDYLIAEDYHHA
ncbi:MAG TPA: metal ABC transporter ATP-binding protein, partial [Nitrospiria bacterium]